MISTTSRDIARLALASTVHQVFEGDLDIRSLWRRLAGRPRTFAGAPPKLRTIESIFHYNAHGRIAIRKQSNIFLFQTRNVRHDYFEEISRA